MSDIQGTPRSKRHSDAQGTPASKRSAGAAPFSPASVKSTGRRRSGAHAARRASGPLASIPSNIQSDLPMLDEEGEEEVMKGPGSQPSGGPGLNSQAEDPAAAGAISELPSLDVSLGAAGTDAQGNGAPGAARSQEQRSGARGGPASSMGGLSHSFGGTPGFSQGSLPSTPGMHVRLTPLPRPELGPGARGRRMSLTSEEGDEGEGGDQVIWGTDYQVVDILRRIRRVYTKPRPDAPQEEPPNLKLLREVMLSGNTAINIDANDVYETDPLLYKLSVEMPADVLPLWDQETAVLQQEQEDVLEQLGLQQLEAEHCVQVRLYNLMPIEVMPIRNLDPVHIEKLVSVKGMVTRVGTVIPDMRVPLFRCERCRHEMPSDLDNMTISEPRKCPRCETVGSMRLIPNRCTYTNRQVVKMQEDPTSVPEGETPRSLLMFTFDTNVDAVKPGDKVVMTGVFRATRLRVNPRQRAMHAMFKTYLDVVHVGKDDQGAAFRGINAGEQTQLSADGTEDSWIQGEPTQASGPDGYIGDNTTRDALLEREQEFRNMVADQEAHYQSLKASIAPKVIQMDEVKEGLLCQLFGGVAKFPSVAGGGGGSRASSIRGDINVLVVGDPSVSKSQLLGFVHLVAPRGVYTSGKGSSAVGLTAYVTKDPETNEMVLESGALVLSDRGICCIDEFDKMSDSARAMLHEVMEQQTVSVAKAGLVSQLNARTSILACANPKGSRYLPEMSLVENINLPPTLLSRFDLVYLVLDEHREDLDRQLGRHLISLFMKDGAAARQEPPYSTKKLKEFIAYARAKVFPKFSDEAAQAVVDCYKTLRQQGRVNEVVMATPRQLEAIIRLSEAWARMGLREEVTVADVKHAYDLWFGALSRSARDAEGKVDMASFTDAGPTSQQKFLTEQLPGVLRTMLQNMFRQGRSTITVKELLHDYELKQKAAEEGAAAGAEAGAEAGKLRAITHKQLLIALHQLSDFIEIKQMKITQRMGGAAAGAADGDM